MACEGVGDGMSMREKALLKRRINKQHNSNFKAGYVPINETYLHKTGLRGRKSFFVYGIVLLLFFIVLGNLLVTFVLLSVLRISYGMEGVEFIPPGRLLKFLVPSDLGNIIPGEGHIGGFANMDLNIEGSKGEEIILETSQPTAHPPTLTLGPKAATIRNVDSFRVINPNNGKIVFSSDYADFGLPVSVKSLNVQKARLARVSSPVDKPLKVSSKKQIRLIGSEGIHMASKEVVWTTNQDLILKSVNGSIIIEALKGLVIDRKQFFSNKIPSSKEIAQYKICVCKHNMRLFRVPIVNANNRHYYNCSNAVASGNINPCAV